jgi:GNAT superfamily N-acetyltransferase
VVRSIRVRQAGDVKEALGGPRPRRAKREEAAGVAAVWLRSRQASIPAIPPPVHTDEEVHEFFATVVLPERETWVIDDDHGEIVALLVLEPGWIHQLYVDPHFTGSGLGSCLLHVAKAVYPEGLDLWTFAANTGARRFYERHGFVAIDSTEGDNEEGAPDIRYHWPATRSGGVSLDQGSELRQCCGADR